MLKNAKLVITEALWSSVIVKTIMVSFHTGVFVVVHLYSTFSVDPRIFPYWQIYTKNYHFRDFGGHKPTFLKSQRWNLAKGCRPGTPFRKPNSVKIAQGGIPLLGKFIPKITKFGYFGGCRPTFLNTQWWNLEWGCKPGTLSPGQILYKKSLKGVYPFWPNLYQTRSALGRAHLPPTTVFRRLKTTRRCFDGRP